LIYIFSLHSQVFRSYLGNWGPVSDGGVDCGEFPTVYTTYEDSTGTDTKVGQMPTSGTILKDSAKDWQVPENLPVFLSVTRTSSLDA
jgi:hypothetical protein